MHTRIHQTAKWLSIAGMAALFAVQAGAVTPSHFVPMTVGAIDGVWTTDLDAAKALAAENGRPMLVYVGNTAECGYCRLSEENVLLVAAWHNYAVACGLPLVYLDKSDARYMSFVTGTSGQFPCYSVYQCPTPTTLTLKGRFIYRPWSDATPQFIYYGIKVVENPANFISIFEAYVGAPVAPLPVMTSDYADVRGDATDEEATELVPLVKPQLTRKHSLNGADTQDWFRMPVVAGSTYRLQNLGVRIVGSTAPTMTVFKDDPDDAPLTQYLLSDTNVHEFVASSSGTYYFRVSRASTAEAVDVNYWLKYQWFVAPPIVSGPPDAFVGIGETASFTVTAQGEGPFTYQWYKGLYVVARATANSYSVVLTTAGIGALYKCKVTNLGGSTFSRVATLSERVGAKLKVTLSPAGVVTAGARWSPDAGGTWYASGATVTLGTGTYTITFEPKSGWTTPAPLTDVSLTSAYVTTPLALTATYTAATLSLAPDTLTLSSNQQDTVINVTATAGLAWTATPSAGWLTIEGANSGTGNGAFTVRASNNSGLEARAGNVTVGSATLAITQNPYRPNGKITVTLLPALAAANGGQWTPNAGTDWYASGEIVSLPQGTYTVAYKPVAGWTTPVSVGATLTVAHTNTPLTITGTYVPVIVLAPTSIQTNAPPTDVLVNVTAPVDYDWDAVPSAAWLTFVGPSSGSGSGTFTLHLATNDTVAVRNGTVTVAGQTLTIAQQPAGGTGPLTIVEQPLLLQKILYGKTATLHVRATGTGPITYQWRKPTLNIVGATSPDYTTPALTATYKYSCLVKNLVSSKVSTYATITVVRMWRTITGNAVEIALVPASATSTWTVTEKIPAGLTPAGYAATGGIWNATLMTITWKSTGKKTVSYTLSGSAGTHVLSGTVKWSIFTAAATTEGDTAMTLPGSLAKPGVGFIFQTFTGRP